GARVQPAQRRVAPPAGPARGGRMTNMLEVEELHVGYAAPEGRVSAGSDVSLEIAEGEIFGLVGESGCGKTTLATAVMGLLPRSADVRGSIRFQQRELVGLGPQEYR